MKGANTKTNLRKIVLYAILITVAVVILVPFYWMIINSLKPLSSFYERYAPLWPKEITFENYTKLIFDTEFVRWFVNSVIVSTATVIIGLLVCSLAGFAFAIYEFRGKKALFWLVLGSVAIPEIVTIIPVYQLMVSWDLIDTYSSLILPYSMNVFGIFLMKQFIETSIPLELIEAGRIDGCSELGILLRVATPLLRPGLGVLGMLLWLHSWSSYFWPLIMLRARDMLTIPLGLATLYADPWNLQYGMLMAGAFISTIPILLIFLLAQEQFIDGLTAGSVKG
jgi:ABC-type glycerol-3-phosphate transport system permease component